LDAQLVKLRPERFLENLQAENFQNVSEIQGKYLRFWTQKSRKCPQNLFLICKVNTSKMRLDFMASSFVFGHKNYENTPKKFL